MDHFRDDDVGKSRTQGFFDGDGGESVCRNTRTENGPGRGERRFTWERRPQLLAQWGLQQVESASKMILDAREDGWMVFR